MTSAARRNRLIPDKEVLRRGGWTVSGVARCGADISGVGGLLAGGGVDAEALEAWLLASPGFFGFVAESDGFVVAAVDRARTYPVYYAENGGFDAAHDPWALKARCGLDEVDGDSLLEFAMSGYVGGARTLYKGLRQLLAGEFLLWDKASKRLELRRYSLFHSPEHPEVDAGDAARELNALHDRMFAGIIERAAGRPVWVPLSGGWDSRLIVSKLVEHGCPNVQTFSYGTPGNHESRLAGRVAAHLGLPWFQVDVTRKMFRDYFWSDARREYFRYAGGLGSMPFVQDAHVLGLLQDEGRLPAEAVIINGQSGDFITGGHLRAEHFADGGGRTWLEDVILDRHFLLWSDLRTPENLVAMRGRVGGVLDALAGAASGAAWDGYLAACWEWQERQCKFVVNGQRAYDFLGLDWELPLWMPEYMDFWEKMPSGLLLGQKLYKDCLLRTGHKDVFGAVGTRVWRWPGLSMGVVPLARLAGVFGAAAKAAVYRTFKFCDHYRYAYGAYSAARCIRLSGRARSANALMSRTWLEEIAPQAERLYGGA